MGTADALTGTGDDKPRAGRRTVRRGRVRPAVACDVFECDAPVDGPHPPGCSVTMTFRVCQADARRMMALDGDMVLKLHVTRYAGRAS